MQVSVAMATYNGARFLRQQLDSIAGQSERPAELVISDDGSTDDTIALAEAFGRDAPFPVRVLPPHERLGFADNFLNAAEHCAHDLVMFADQDDVWDPRKLEASRRRLLDDGSLLALHALTMVDMDLRPVGHFSQGIAGDRTFAPLELEPYLSGYGNTMMFRRELAHLVPRRQRPKTGTRLLSHDTWIYTLAAAVGSVSHLGNSYILYRQHEANVTAVDARPWRRRMIDLATFQVQHYREIAQFDRDLAAVFADAAEENAAWGVALRAAATRYRQRATQIDHRLSAYEGKNISARWAAFRAAHSQAGKVAMEAGSSTKVALKDFVVGVLRLGKKA